jgi:integrase
MNGERLVFLPGALLLVPVQHRVVSRRRAYGTGCLYVKTTSRGQETWYGQFRIGGRQVKRALGAKRAAGSADGLTRTQAERKLRQLIEATRPLPSERLTVAEAGRRLVAHLGERGRKRSTLMNYESCLRVHLVPFFGARPLHRITREHVDAFIALKARQGLAPKSVLNYLGVLHSVFAFAERRGLVAANPCNLVDKPRAAGAEARIRFLTPSELDDLLGVAAGATSPIASTDRLLYLTAALTGLRQGELLALRWKDVDWDARRVRVRESLVRGEFTTPKSRRSTRSVPLATRVASELADHRLSSAFGAPDDLVFCHPRLGGPLERSRLFKRFKSNAVAAGFPEMRFHDLRHTFGTRMAGAGVPLRTLQEWMGHRDFKTTLIYTDYQPRDDEVEFVDRAFAV